MLGFDATTKDMAVADRQDQGVQGGRHQRLCADRGDAGASGADAHRPDPRRHRLRRGDHRGRRDLGLRARLRLRQQRPGRAVHRRGGNRGPARRPPRQEARLPVPAGAALPQRLPQAGARHARADRPADRPAAALARQPDRRLHGGCDLLGKARRLRRCRRQLQPGQQFQPGDPARQGDFAAARGGRAPGKNPAQLRRQRRAAQRGTARRPAGGRQLYAGRGAPRHLAPADRRGGPLRRPMRCGSSPRTSPPRPA